MEFKLTGDDYRGSKNVCLVKEKIISDDNERQLRKVKDNRVESNLSFRELKENAKKGGAGDGRGWGIERKSKRGSEQKEKIA